MEQLLAAVDIGGTKVTASVSDRGGILAKVREPTRLRGENNAIPLQVIRMIETAASRAGRDSADVRAVGVSTCSPFQTRGDERVVVAPNLCGGLGWSRKKIPNDWEYVPLERELTARFPSVSIGNDCITAVSAERLFGAGRGEDNLLYVTWSTGIGAGAYVDGHLLTGKNDNAVHLGHILVNLDTERSLTEGWQDAENLESFVAGPAIARLYGGDVNTLEVFNRYRSGDREAAAVIERAANIFARALVGAVTLLDTKKIIIGGSVSNDWDVLGPLVEKEFFAANPFFVNGVRIVQWELGRYLGDLAGLSTVMPESWVDDWQDRRPWENAPEAEEVPEE